MNPLAVELNKIIEEINPNILDMLSDLGKELYFPKGILSQSAEAKKLGKKYNATIGIGKENGSAMYMPVVMEHFNGLSEDETLPYAPSPGQPELRELWKKLIYEKNPGLNKYEISLPVVTSGITHGLSMVADMFVNPDDTILIPDKIWGNYNLIFKVRKKSNFRKFTFFDNERFNIESFRKTLNEEAEQKDKLIVLLNFPNNPTGYTPTTEEAEAISRILIEVSEKCKLIVLCDDAYFGLVYEEGIFTESIFSKLANANPNLLAVKLDGATKEFFVWGFRTAFVTFGTTPVNGNINGLYLALEKKAGGCIRGCISNSPNSSQNIMIKVLSNPAYKEQKSEKYNVLKKRANKIKDILKDPKFDKTWEYYPFNSGYFMCLKLKNIDAEELRVLLLNEYQTGTIAVNKTDLRIAFSSVELDDIEGLYNTLYEAAVTLSNR